MITQLFLSILVVTAINVAAELIASYYKAPHYSLYWVMVGIISISVVHWICGGCK